MRIEIKSLSQSIVCDFQDGLFVDCATNYFWQEFIPGVHIHETNQEPDLHITQSNEFNWCGQHIQCRNTISDFRSVVVIIGTLLEKERQKKRMYQVHGATVAINKMSVALVGGMSGLGKTSLAVALSNFQNTQLLGDEKFVIDGINGTVIAGCQLTKDNKKVDWNPIIAPSKFEPQKLGMVVFPIITNEQELTAHKYDELKLFWHLYEEASRDIRNLNFLFNDFSETRNSFDTDAIMRQRILDIKNIAKTVPAYYIRGSLPIVAEHIYNFMMSST